MNVALRRKLFVMIIIAAVVLTTAYGFFWEAIEVDLVPVIRAPLQVTIEEEGRTRLKERFVVTAPVTGYMERISAKVGDMVQKGQNLVVLNPLRSPALDPRSRAEAEVGVRTAEAALHAAVEKESAAAADADYLEKKLERMKNLYSRGSIAKDQYDQMEAEAKKMRAIHRSSRAAVDVARSDLERTKTILKDFAAPQNISGHSKLYVSSPVSGSIFRVYRESEGTVNVGDPLFDIGNVREMEVRVEVLSSDAVKIKPGTTVFFKRWGGEKTLTGKVRVVEPAGFTKISSLGVEEQRTLIIAEITSPAEIWEALGDTYRLEAHFVVWEGRQILQVPTSALFRYGQEWALFVAENGKAQRRMVEIGQNNGLAAQIIAGVKEKELVIAHPDDAVSDGVRIKQR